MRQVQKRVEDKNPVRYTYQRGMRVKTHEQFQRVYEKGCSYVDRSGVFYILPSSSGCSQLGTAVGRRLGHAVVRNRIKRRMREVFRLNRHRLTKPVCLVWVARRGLVHAPYPVYEKTFLRLAQKAGLLERSRV